MDKKEKQEYIQRYNERLKRYGKDTRTLGWRRGRQEIRFEALTGIGTIDGAKVLDVGCGFGDLLGYLKGKGIDVDYHGWDINPNLIEIAREEHPEGTFSVIDVSEYSGDDEFDYVFSSGIFNYAMSDNEQFIKTSLSTMFDISRRGVATDFMTSYVDYENEDAYYAEPEEIFGYCKGLSMRVALRHDYLPYEFCVYIYIDDDVDDKNRFSGFGLLC